MREGLGAGNSHGQPFAASVRPFAPLALFVIIVSVPVVAGALFAVTGAVFGTIGGDPGAAR